MLPWHRPLVALVQPLGLLPCDSVFPERFLGSLPPRRSVQRPASVERGLFAEAFVIVAEGDAVVVFAVAAEVSAAAEDSVVVELGVAGRVGAVEAGAAVVVATADEEPVRLRLLSPFSVRLRDAKNLLDRLP